MSSPTVRKQGLLLLEGRRMILEIAREIGDIIRARKIAPVRTKFRRLARAVHRREEKE